MLSRKVLQKARRNYLGFLGDNQTIILATKLICASYFGLVVNAVCGLPNNKRTSISLLHLGSWTYMKHQSSEKINYLKDQEAFGGMEIMLSIMRD